MKNFLVYIDNKANYPIQRMGAVKVTAGAMDLIHNPDAMNEKRLKLIQKEISKVFKNFNRPYFKR